MKQLQCDYNRTVTYLVGYKANHLTDFTCVISLREREALHSAYVIGIDLRTTYDVHLGLIGKPAPAPVVSQGGWHP